MATTVSHHIPTTQAHAIADLTGYEDADTLCWQQAGVTAQQRTGEQGRDAGTDTDRLAHGLDLAPRGAEPLLPPDTTPRVPNTSLQEGPAAAGPGATASEPERARRTRTVRTHRGQVPAPTGSAACWPTSEAPASMNVKLKVGNMEIMYTARDTNDRDLQARMTTLLPWLAEMMAACEANYEARQHAAKQTAKQPTPTPPPAPEPERTLGEQSAAAVQAARQAQAGASTNGAGPAADGRRTPPLPPASERTNDMDPSWCAIHHCQMPQRSNARGAWYSHRLPSGAYCKGE